MRREMIIFAYKHTDNQTDTNSKTEAHSYPLWILGERANYLGFITVIFLEFRSRGEQRRMWRKMRIFADKQSNKQILIQRLSHTLILCGYLESGPIIVATVGKF